MLGPRSTNPKTMKKIIALLALVAGLLTGCSTATVRKGHGAAETVMIVYRVKPGKEAEMKAVLERAWTIYREGHLVFAEPHVITQEKEKSGRVRLVEIFTWVSADVPDHAPDSVKTIWNEMVGLCEARDGHGGLEGGEVDLLAGGHK